MNVLTINMGSSSLKFSLYRMGDGEALRCSGLLDGIGQGHGRTLITDSAGRTLVDEPAVFPGAAATLQTLVAWLNGRAELAKLDAVGHRVVHGGPHHAAPAIVDAALVAELRTLIPLAPLHLPHEIAAIEGLLALLPGLPQIACFDTAFHRSIPETARTYALPRRFRDARLQRYGFHGLSYEFIVEELAREAGAGAARGRLIIAHLGNGASMAAVRDGKCADTTMGLTPTGGLVMGTRPGDLDPGILVWMLQEQGVTVPEMARLVQHEGGLLGLSGISSDVRDLLRPDAPPAAKEALAVFGHVARKNIGALTALLGGLDTLVFTAGIGEHAAPIRADICRNLGYLGLQLDEARNAAHAPVISAEASRVCVRVMHTNEELQIARHTYRTISSAGR